MTRSWILNASGLLVTSALFAGGCGDDKETASLDDAKPFVARYAELVLAGYTDAHAEAEALNAAVAALVDGPSDTTLEAARDAWLAAREPYGQTEAFRFYGGPIDDDDGPEGQINAWPLDEAFIDYVEGDDTAGIINNTADFPTLSSDDLIAENGNGGEDNVSTGYHAIEFLLWGQDRRTDGAGERAFTDYVVGAEGTAANQDRRAQYLSIVSDLLVSDLNDMVDAWSDTDGSYAQQFELDPKLALTRIITGMGSLSGAELSGERMLVAYDNRDQEDEHSCFSDNTRRDLHLNALGIRNVYLGSYGSDAGPSLSDVVRARDAALDAKLLDQLDATMEAIDAIPQPFDQAILGDDTDPGRIAVKAAIDALQAETATIVEVATLLGITINLE